MCQGFKRIELFSLLSNAIDGAVKLHILGLNSLKYLTAHRNNLSYSIILVYVEYIDTVQFPLKDPSFERPLPFTAKSRCQVLHFMFTSRPTCLTQYLATF